jgi:hypothetical protein
MSRSRSTSRKRFYAREAVAVAVASAWIIGCHMDAKGLQGVLPGTGSPGGPDPEGVAPGNKYVDAAPRSPEGPDGGAGTMQPRPPLPGHDAAGARPGDAWAGGGAAPDGGAGMGGAGGAPGSDAAAAIPKDAGGGADAGAPGAPPVSACSAPLPGTLAVTSRSGIPSYEDLTFDDAGYLVTVVKRDVVRIGARGPMEVMLKTALGKDTTIAAVRPLAGGDFLISDYDRDEVVRVSPTGTRRKLATADRPSRIARGPGGKFYVTSLDGLVLRLDADTGTSNIVATLYGRTSGVGFSLDYGTIYVTDIDAGALYRARLKPDGTAEELAVWVKLPFDSLDGIATDECGNVYVASYRSQALTRVTPAGKVDVVARFDDSVSLPTFGVAGQGFDDRSLYMNNLDRNVAFEVKVGLRAAPPPPSP